MPASRFETTRREPCVLIPLTAYFHRMAVFGPQLLSIHTLSRSAPANPFESHSFKKSRINIKTKPFKPRRITLFPHVISQLLWNHILLKMRVGGRGSTSSVNRRAGSHESPVTNHRPRRFLYLITLLYPLYLLAPRDTDHGPRISA
jgi:hypothetical protein